MSDTSVSGAGRRHFSPEEEAMLQRNESTNDIVKRDTGKSADIHGHDLTQVELKKEQNRHIGGLGAAAIAENIAEGADIAGGLEKAAKIAEHLGASEQAAMAGEGVVVATLPILGMVLGWAHLLEARAQGNEQAEALTQENMHVATLGALDLPPDYKARRLDEDYKLVPQGARSEATKLTDAIMKDPKGRAVLQLHCDQGMHAAKDLVLAKQDLASFFKTHPKAAESYARDAAFREGFDAYLTAKDRAGADRALAERDGWYAQSHINVRV